MWKTIFGPLVRPAMRDGMDSTEVHRMWVLLPTMAIGMFLTTLGRVAYLLHGGSVQAAWTTSLWHVGVFIYIYYTHTLPRRLFEVEIMYYGVQICIFYDLISWGALDQWSHCVIIMDILLLTQSTSLMVGSFRNIMLGYLLAKSAEDVYQFGLYRPFPPTATRECEAISPAQGVFLFLSRFFCIMVDFNLTRRFANGMYTEQARMEAVIHTTECIASSLAQFDLEAAGGALEGVEDGPLKSALASLLRNLDNYRPFLPEALFPKGSGSEGVPPHIPPPQGPLVALVFTDIQSSSVLWEASRLAMGKALALHNSIIRQCLNAALGYEVKIIGDAFMAAFQTATDACNFSVAAQLALHEASWPDDLPIPRGPLRNGLQVRMGINCGEVDIQINPVTGRADYFGPTVNVAARVEGVCRGGEILITSHTLRHLQVDGTMCVIPYGTAHLRGVAEGVELFYCMPTSLAPRITAPDEPVPHPATPTTAAPSLPLERLSGTAGITRVEYRMHEHEATTVVNEAVQAILVAAHRTKGVVDSVRGSSVAVMWCGGAPHVTRAVQYVGLLWEAVDPHRWGKGVTVGLASGDVLQGTVGTTSQRFVTFIGNCVELAGWLSGCAPSISAFALVASTDSTPFVTRMDGGHRARKVAVQSHSFGTVEVYSLCAPHLLTKWSSSMGRTAWGDEQPDERTGLPDSTPPLVHALPACVLLTSEAPEGTLESV